MANVLKKFDKIIEDSNYELGNRSDIVGICENRVIDYNNLTSTLRSILKEMEAKTINTDRRHLKGRKQD